MPESDGLIEHLEHFLGPIAGGWTEDAQGVRLPFQIVKFDRQDDGSVIFSTLGLSRHVLEIGSKTIRQELVMAVDPLFATTELVGILDTVGEMLLNEHRALLQGEVIPPRGPVVAGSTLSALYVAQPVILPDEFGVFAGNEPPPTVFVLLLPISYAEAGFIGTHGWRWFEDRLLEQQPNLYDLKRADIAHGDTLNRNDNQTADSANLRGSTRDAGDDRRR